MTSNHTARLKDRIISSYRSGESYRWVSCLAASRIVGRYQPGLTRSVASELALSPSTIENMARAGVVYRWLCKIIPHSDLVSVRRALTYSHFAVVGDLMHAYEYPLEQAWAYLSEAAAERYSVAKLQGYIEGDIGQAPDEWRGRVRRLLPLLSKLINDYGVPDNIRAEGLNFLHLLNTEITEYE